MPLITGGLVEQAGVLNAFWARSVMMYPCWPRSLVRLSLSQLQFRVSTGTIRARHAYDNATGSRDANKVRVRVRGLFGKRDINYGNKDKEGFVWPVIRANQQRKAGTDSDGEGSTELSESDHEEESDHKSKEMGRRAKQARPAAHSRCPWVRSSLRGRCGSSH
jgi:hypothetical protein